MPVKHKPRKHIAKKSSHHATIPVWAKSPTPVPPALLHSILVAAKKYNVPPDLLAGIWRRESGSTYPNPAVNSSGYGGLFGTTNAYGSTQSQANLSASILANGLKASKGNLSQALSYYNSGKLSGGYTSVPGQVSSGVMPGYGGRKSGSQTSSGGISGFLNQYFNPGSFVSDLSGGGVTSAVEKPVISTADKIMDAAAILGGGFVFVLGFVLVSADIGLSSRAGRVAASIPAARYLTKPRKESSSASRSREETPEERLVRKQREQRAEERKEEAHRVKIAHAEASVKHTQAKTTEVRTRQKNRRKTAKEQKAENERHYKQGAIDAASPTMAKIRKSKKR